MVSFQQTSLEARLRGSFLERFWLELFSNSAHFIIANILLELLTDYSLDYLLNPELYILIGAGLLQAYWLTRWQTTPTPRRLLGNLIGPAFYTIAEVSLDGLAFFYAPHHLAYWFFGLTIGLLQAVRPSLPPSLSGLAIVVENIVRTSIIFFMYVIFETYTEPIATLSFNNYFADTAHQFIGLAVLLLGASIGLANLTAERYLALLRQTSEQLKTYSEWLLGHELLGQAFSNPTALNLSRRERTVLFMDIRGFTHWSEAQSPERVVALLDQYYQISDGVLARHQTIKFKFSADEVMAVFPTADIAVQAALTLREPINKLLREHQLGAGIGLHCGLLVEGLLGSSRAKFYDVIGDTVNTAKRIEGAAQSAEVLISEAARQALTTPIPLTSKREITAKGKDVPVTVYPIDPSS